MVPSVLAIISRQRNLILITRTGLGMLQLNLISPNFYHRVRIIPKMVIRPLIMIWVI